MSLTLLTASTSWIKLWDADSGTLLRLYNKYLNFNSPSFIPPSFTFHFDIDLALLQVLVINETTLFSFFFFFSFPFFASIFLLLNSISGGELTAVCLDDRGRKFVTGDHNGAIKVRHFSFFFVTKL